MFNFYKIGTWQLKTIKNNVVDPKYESLCKFCQNVKILENYANYVIVCILHIIRTLLIIAIRKKLEERANCP